MTQQQNNRVDSTQCNSHTDAAAPSQGATPADKKMPAPQSNSEQPRSYRFFRSILTHRRWIVTLFAVFTLLCALCISQVTINYDLADYLPEEANSSEALTVMEEVYGSEIPNARLYAQDLSLSQASRLADELSYSEGVEDVLWLGSQIDTLQPLSIAPEATVEQWKSDEGYLYQLTLDESIASETIAEIRATAQAEGAGSVALSGSAVTTVAAMESTATEILYIMLLAVAIIIVIISLTSKSWFEPVIFLLVLAMAIIMNMGTNIFKGEISFITQICAAVLQLAVSMDYAIVMLHTFRRYQDEYPGDSLLAMTHAMHKGFTVVLSSAAVTFFGFLSLSVMSFEIGVDMGVVLAKGIFFSFLSVMFLMPCIILACLKPLTRFEHKPLMPSFDRFGVWCTRLMVPLSLVVVLLAVPAVLGQDKTDFTYGNAGMIEEGSEQALEKELIDDTFGSEETWVMLVPEGEWAAEQALVSDLKALPKVDNVISYASTVGAEVPTEMVPQEQREQLLKGGYSRIVIQTTLNASTGTDYDMVGEVRELGSKHFGEEAYLAGTQVSEFDLKTITSDDSMKVKLFSTGTIALVLALMFRSLSIPLIVLLPIEVSIWLNLAIPYFTGQSINYIGYLVIDAVQLGAAVDYAIIYTREYLEQRQQYRPLKAAQVAISKSALTIMTSALILTIAGLSIFFIASNSIISEIGMLVGRGAFLAMLMMFTVLPLLFIIADWLIRHTSLGLRFSTSTPSKLEKEPVMNTQKSAQTQKTARQTKKRKRSNLRMQRIGAGALSIALVTAMVPVSSLAYADDTTNALSAQATASALSVQSTTSTPSVQLATSVPSTQVATNVLSAHPTASAPAAPQSTTSTPSVQSTTSAPLVQPATSAPSAPQATTNDPSAQVTSTPSAQATTNPDKEELVYVKLSGQGKTEGIYVVNSFSGSDSSSEQTVLDPGTYESVTNLTSDADLTNTGGSTKIHLGGEDVAYEGELAQDTALPWDISLAYSLDGTKINSKELSGATGQLEIDIAISATDEGTTFSDNYLLQGSGSFSNSCTRNVACEEASLASAGSAQQVTFMVLPGNDASYHLEADVEDFSFEGFTIVGVPLSFAFDLDEMDTSELDEAVGTLQDAVKELDEGAQEISANSETVATALSTLASTSEPLIGGSYQIQDGLTSVYSASGSIAEGSSAFVGSMAQQNTDAAALSAFYAALANDQQLAYAANMQGAQASLSNSEIALAQAYLALQQNDSVALEQALNSLAGELAATGGALQGVNTAIGTVGADGLVSYQAQAAAYGASAQTLSEVSNAYAPLDTGVKELNTSMPKLTAAYSSFNEGLTAYTAGVNSLNDGYTALNSGIGSLSTGTSSFRSEVATLDQDLLDGMQEELEQKLNPDFELCSFVDETNTAVERVQFIFMTDTIEEPQKELAFEEEVEEEETVWTRFLALFE